MLGRSESPADRGRVPGMNLNEARILEQTTSARGCSTVGERTSGHRSVSGAASSDRWRQDGGSSEAGIVKNLRNTGRALGDASSGVRLNLDSSSMYASKNSSSSSRVR